MRVAHRLLRSAAAAGLVSLAAACIVPPAGIAPRPQEDLLPTPDVRLYGINESPASAGSGVVAFSVTRDAYVAAFVVDQRGRVSVLAPTTPREPIIAAAGKSYVLFPQTRLPDREVLTSSTTDFSRVPFVFVLTADTPFDLSAFGKGREWTHDLVVQAANPDSTITRVAERVLGDAPAYGSDYAYVGPMLRAGENALVADCARPLEDVHDYSYFRDLWAVFTPADQRISVNPWLFSPALGWSSYSYLPLATYRAQLAPAAFYAGCEPSTVLWNSGVAGWNGFTYAPWLFGALGGGYYGTPSTPYGGWGYTVITPVVRTLVRSGPHVPQTPVSLGTLQVTSGAPGTNPSSASTALANGRLAWRPTNRTPGEVVPTARGFGTGDVGRIATSDFARVIRPIERRGFETQPVGGDRMSGGRSMPQLGNSTQNGWRGRGSESTPVHAASGYTPTHASPSYTPTHSAPSSTTTHSAPAASPAPASSPASSAPARSGGSAKPQ